MADRHPIHSAVAEAFGQTIDLDEDSGEDYGGRHPNFVPDEQAMDLDATSMRDGPSDMRAYYADKNLHVDTPQDQQRVKRAYEDAASRNADLMMAQYKTQEAQPSAVASRLQQPPVDEEDQQRLAAIQFLRGMR